MSGRVQELNRKLNNIIRHSDVRYKQIIIDGMKCQYIVSSIGEVYSMHYNHKRNTVRKLKQRTKKDGYKEVAILVNGKMKRFMVHRLVALAFIPNPRKEADQVNHINGVKSDNYVENLEWVTGSENIKHAFDHGLCHGTPGEERGLSKFTNAQIEEACSLLEQNLPYKIISERTGVSRGILYCILKGRAWKSISKKYDLSNYTHGKPVDHIDRIHEVCKLLEEGRLSPKEISEITGIKKDTILCIRRGLYYKQISSQYNIKYPLK